MTNLVAQDRGDLVFGYSNIEQIRMPADLPSR